MKRVAVLGSEKQFERFVFRLVPILGNATISMGGANASFRNGTTYYHVNSLKMASGNQWDDYALLSGIASPTILKVVQENMKRKGKEA